ncbi:MAG: NAD-dependent epimerase/dehydratase family protein [Gammaproteobacteria bacterium]|nr:NAD-dependent epimerase/dehydratase family protein [Gammaproteobacteria bacterium]
MKILITGASGFVGRKLCVYLKEQGHEVVAAVRDDTKRVDGIRCVIIGCIDENTAWGPSLEQVDAVIHLAARAHILSERSEDPLSEFRAANTYPTEKLAHDSIKAGVKRFVFVSSIGVNGARTSGSPFKVSDPVCPHSPYAVSKLEAERVLERLFNDSATDFIILRPPLIYGVDAPGNVRLISGMLKYNIPIPFGAVSNRRSFIAIDNLVSILGLCLTHPKALNKVILPSDGFDLSTKEFIEIIGIINGRTPFIVSVYPRLIDLFLRLIGKRRMSESLLCDLLVDSQYLFDDLGWVPVFNVNSQLNRKES